MIRIKELLDNPLPFIIKKEDPIESIYEFKIDEERIYSVYITKDFNHMSNLENLLQDQGINVNIFPNKITKIQECHEIHFSLLRKYKVGTHTRNRRTSYVTDTGDQFTVFATILDIMNYYLRRYEVYYWAIMSKVEEKSRIKLYEFFATKINKYLPFLYIGNKTFKDLEETYSTFYCIQESLYKSLVEGQE